MTTELTMQQCYDDCLNDESCTGVQTGVPRGKLWCEKFHEKIDTVEIPLVSENSSNENDC